MKNKIIKKIRFIILITFLSLSFIPFSVGQLLSPLETQPSDFGEAKIPSHSNENQDTLSEEKFLFSESDTEQFVVKTKGPFKGPFQDNSIQKDKWENYLQQSPPSMNPFR